MVSRRFVFRHDGEDFPVEFDTDNGFEVLKFQIFSLTSVPPDDQKILAEKEGYLIDESSDLGTIPEKLRLVSIQDSGESSVGNTDEELARMLQAEEEALLFQRFSVGGDGGEFKRRVEPYVKQVYLYEDATRQESARKSVPIDEIEEKALVSLAKEGNINPSKAEEDYAFLLQLLFWFKHSFRWVNSPPCDYCGKETMNIGMGIAVPSEIEFGGSRVELYRCKFCSCVTRFPRYNDPLKLLETKRGRCGEWANCFTLYCRAFGYKARLIMDFTDHVWTECFSVLSGRWMHLDPCEGVYDNPLLYEEGWNKKLNYIIAIAKDGVYDVTRRYTRKWPEVLSRRTMATESVVSAILSSITKTCRSGYSSESLTLLEYCDKKEAEELETAVYSKADASISLPGRQSGAVEWRKARSEFGSDESQSVGCSSCPVRQCVDSHVANIYSGFAFLVRHLCENEITKDRCIEILEMLKNLLVDLSSTPFRNRSSFLDPNASQILKDMMLCIKQLLSAISLRADLGNDGLVSVTLSGNPVQTSLALPVAVDVVNEIINDSRYNEFPVKNIQFPRTNRLSSASVLVSGEQLPVGIATSAFDGTRLSKWEEPNGAKGCWLIYKVLDGQMYDLESYDLMSANDAPERDPMDWILEGSADGGSSWNVLDKQSSQIFGKRFLRTTFKIERRYMCNAFRFQFLRVRDANATSRFQIGGIDLYAKAK
ncbi:peptide-N(4)-(N-acetyl-beta-glucosaminyl)asparagine amidase [Typha angustifolia]|uniref:peptide-N(4)-(N-acetyl-beta- glucosaminyl)asparagine amidase n=1 Tax=Typha angustifolia TaxID=59011 RepID=UPI003C30399F